MRSHHTIASKEVIAVNSVAFGSLFELGRRQMGWTIEKAEEHTGIDRGRIWRIEQGARPRYRADIDRLIEVYELDDQEVMLAFVRSFGEEALKKLIEVSLEERAFARAKELINYLEDYLEVAA